ncbi:MAG: diguanylate cyclase [Desulfosarcinaceae bacterium]|nr:diguanylate cyclase [Desulfosarcinaceae bacterium]
MALFSRKRTPCDTDPATPKPDAAQLADLSELYLRAINALFMFITDFALDIKEIGADRFKAEVDQLKTDFNAQLKSVHLDRRFQAGCRDVSAFIERQKRYIGDREQELRDIIDLLTMAMTSLNSDNKTFYRRVFDQSEKIEQISRLDDIKKIKVALQEEVNQMKSLVSAKETADAAQIDQLSSQVSELKNELQKVRQRSETDGLTGVLNRQAFDAVLADLVSRREVTGKRFSLLLLDLDNFKGINDTYGHLTGDRVLVAFAQKCKGMLRGDDIIARYGGEEFAILLPGASLRNSVKKGRQICEAIAGTRYAIDEGAPGDYLNVTVSVGVSTLRKGDTPVKLIDRADRALYHAKGTGKNKVVSEKQI